jgi:hypothetical protein
MKVLSVRITDNGLRITADTSAGFAKLYLGVLIKLAARNTMRTSARNMKTGQASTVRSSAAYAVSRRQFLCRNARITLKHVAISVFVFVKIIQNGLRKTA